MAGINLGKKLFISATSLASFCTVYLGTFYVSPSYVQLEIGQPANAGFKIPNFKNAAQAGQKLVRVISRKGKKVLPDLVEVGIKSSGGNSSGNSPTLDYRCSIFVDNYGNRLLGCNGGDWYVYNPNIGNFQQIYRPSGNIYPVVHIYEDSSGRLFQAAAQ